MERHLSLIKTDYQELEKRVFPRFPFGFMMFKDAKMVFEIKDISLTGMQITFKDGEHNYKVDSTIEGELQWRGQLLKVKGLVKWCRNEGLGISFEKGISFESKMREFLSFENIVSHIKPLHETSLDLDLPNNLKYWLKADGVLDFYIWEHQSQGISRFQILMMEHFIEWQEGVGVKTGRIMTQRNLDMPLSSENECLFQIDEVINTDKVEMALGVVSIINTSLLPKEARDFILYKLRN